MQRSAVVLGLVAVAAVIWGAPSAEANSNGDWSVFPVADDTGDPGVLPRPYFEYRVAAGAVIEDEVVVSNLTDDVLSLTLYPADAYNSENAGQFTLDLLDESRDFIGRWVKLSAGQLELPARSQAVIPFTITFPDGLPPGDYAGGIVALNEATDALDDTGFLVQSGVGTRIYARVGGASDVALEITDLDLALSAPLLEGVTGEGTGELTYRIRNVGNVRISSTVQASVERTFAEQLTFSPRELPELLPGEEVTVTESWSGLPPIGVVAADVTVTADEVDLEVTRSTRAVVAPWWLLGVLALLLGVFAYRARRRAAARKAALGRPVRPRRELVAASSSNDADPTPGG